MKRAFSIPPFCVPALGHPSPLASISLLGGREEGAGLWAWEHSFGRVEVVVFEGAVGDWRLVNKSAENNSLDFNMSEKDPEKPYSLN